MGIQRPDGPYSVEMTAGSAWPGANENSYRDRADELRATLRSLTSTCEQWEQQRATLFNGDLVWSGEAATAAAAEVDKRTAAMHTLQDQLRAAATRADTTAAVIGAVKTQVTENVETAQKIIDQINNTPAATAEQKSAAIEQVVTATHATNTEAVAAGAAQLGAAPPATPLNFGPTNTAPPQAPAPKKEEIPPPGTDPETSRRWWDSHTPQEKEALIRDHPEEIGNLAVVPPAIRDEALRRVMKDDLARVDRIALGQDSQRCIDVDEIRAHPDKYGLTTRDILRYDQACEARARLEQAGNRTGARTRIWLLNYRPEAFNGEGGVSIGFGEIEKATNVAVDVPGTGHSLAQGLDTAVADAANHYNAAMEAGESTAVILYNNHDTPNSPFDGRIASTGLAREGAAVLASDINGLRSNAQVPQHYVVGGHSYGSTTVADAVMMGMRTNDVILLGSPGTDLAHSAADLRAHLEGGQVYVGSASTDPITKFGDTAIPAPWWGDGATIGLGADPATAAYGAERFKAEVPGISSWPMVPGPLGTLATLVEDHSRYYARGSESLRSITLITTGQGASLDDQGLTALPRLPGMPPLADPELIRPPGWRLPAW